MRINKNEAVVLLHGVGLSSLFMQKIEKSLYEEGFVVYNIDYPSRRHNIETTTSYVFHQLQKKPIGDCKQVHFIGHSLGGVLLRNITYRYCFHNLGKVIALAPPNHGSSLVDRFKMCTFIRWYLGPSFLELGTDSEFLKQLVYVPKMYYVIAGSRSVLTCFGFLINGINDGVVTVESTVCDEMERAQHQVFPVTHFSILWNKKVMSHIIGILKK
jgi:esterase/lipase